MKIMHRLSTLVLALLLAACGSEPTSLDDGASIAQSVEVVEGDGQTVQVTETTDTVSALVEDDLGNALSGQLTSWGVDGPSECGNWEATSLESNASGLVSNVLHVGTVADTRTDVDCTFRVVHSEQGAPAPLVDSVEVVVDPGAVAVNDFAPPTFKEGAVPHGGMIPSERMLMDQHENPIPFTLTVLSGPFRIEVDSSRSNPQGIMPTDTSDVSATGALRVTETRTGNVLAEGDLWFGTQKVTHGPNSPPEWEDHGDPERSICFEVGSSGFTDTC